MTTNEFADWIAAAAEGWSDIVQDPQSVYIDPTSDLAGDAGLPGGVAPAQLAWRAIGTAGEHVGAMHHILSTTNGGVMAKPYLSLARATMLGAARALYVLEADTPGNRRSRSLQLLRAEAEDLHRLVSDWERAATSTDVVEARREIDAFRAECERELLASGLKAGSVKTETTLLLDIAHHLDDTARDPVAAVMNVWRSGSGTAHGRSWMWDSGLEDQEPAEQLARIWYVPLSLQERAWELWNLRKGTPGVEASG